MFLNGEVSTDNILSVESLLPTTGNRTRQAAALRICNLCNITEKDDALMARAKIKTQLEILITKVNNHYNVSMKQQVEALEVFANFMNMQDAYDVIFGVNASKEAKLTVEFDSNKLNVDLELVDR